ncbi:MAG: M20/M25/M40 family metallo-hydrolase, partial [Acetobacteraceae bacterium]
NTPAEGALAAEASAAAGLTVRRDMAAAMTGEDFSWYLVEKPGAFAWIGNGASQELHNAGYNYNDSILPAAATYLASVAKRALAG